MSSRFPQTGHTLVELVIVVAITAMLLTGLQQLLGSGVSVAAVTQEQTELARQGRFAMARMVDAVGASNHLLIPLANNPTTTFDEHIRLQTVPASAPQTGSVLASAVLAVTLDTEQDMDENGIADADNDGDGQFDEDLPADTQNDGKAGVRDFDDDGNGTKDFFLSPPGDDDESNDLQQSEDPINGLDDDGDGSIDEDPSADMNGDGCSGVCNVDEDDDGTADEDDAQDDDEDGQEDEDWYDPVVFYLQGSALIERRAVPWDESGDSAVTGQDFVESTLADNVTLLRFERIALSSGEQQLVDITLGLTRPNGEALSLNAQVRVGGSR